MKYLFQTEHLRIRRFEAEDARQLYKNHLEEEMKQWIPNESYESLEEAAGAIAFYQSCVDEGHLPYVLAVEHRETGELIGDTGVNEVETIVWISTYALVVISPMTITSPVVQQVSQATRDMGSILRHSSRIASEILSQILSG